MEILANNTILLNRYRVEKLITSAGQCFGYSGTDLNASPNEPWKAKVFLKQYHDLIPGSEEAAALAAHYENLRKRLGENWSTYICLPMEMCEAGNSIVTVFPFVAGHTLKDLFERGITQEESVRIAFALIKTMRALHYKQIAHLDLKPENVVIKKSTKDGKLYLRLIDLDAARIDGIGLRHSVKGTNYYYSPEHCFPDQFGTVSVSSDVFTMGIMIFTLLLKQHPFCEAEDYSQAISSEDYQVPGNQYNREVMEKLISCLRADQFFRPTAGSVLAIFNRYFETGLCATNDDDRWKDAKRFVQLTGVGENASFSRTYYNSIIMDRNQLRGALATLEPGPQFQLLVDKSGAYIVKQEGGPTLRLQGRTLPSNRPIPLEAVNMLRIDRNPEIVVSVGTL